MTDQNPPMMPSRMENSADDDILASTRWVQDLTLHLLKYSSYRRSTRVVFTKLFSIASRMLVYSSAPLLE